METEDKFDFKKVLPVFVIVLIDLLGMTIIIPLMPFYAASFGANAFVVGALGATYPIMQFFGAPVLGRLSDQYGRRPILIISQIGTFIGFILLGFSNSLVLVFISRIIDGISGANIATAQAVITDNTSEKNRTQGLGLIGAAFGLGFIIGPVIAFVSLSVSGNDYRVPAFVAAAFSFVSILLTYFWLEESHPAEKRGDSVADESGFRFTAMVKALRRPTVGFLLILMFFQQFAFGGFEQLLSLFTLSRLGMNASSNSALFVYIGIIVVMVQGYFVGKWSRKFGDRWLIVMGLIVLGVGLLLTTFTPRVPVPWYTQSSISEELSGNEAKPGETPPVDDIQIDIPDDSKTGWFGLLWIIVAMVPAAIGGGVLQPSINSMITKQVLPVEIGGILGISASFLSGANAITPLVMGAFFQWVGASAPFFVGGVILMVLWLFAKRMLPNDE